MESSPQRRTLNSLKENALSHPIIGSLSLFSWHMVPTCLPGAALPVCCTAVVSVEETECNKQNPAQGLAVLTLHFLCSHFKIIKAAPESIRSS